MSYFKLTLMAGILLLPSFLSQADTERQSFRAGKWEGSIGVHYFDSGRVDGQQGSFVDIDSDIGWGFSLGYHYSSNLLINVTFIAVNQDYGALLASDTLGERDVLIRHTLDMYSTQLNGVYHFMDTAFTPYVQAGLGWTTLDSNIASRPGYVGCWYDPWWGYLCDEFVETYGETNFSYNLGLGLRWELNFDTFLRAGYHNTWMDLDNAGTYDVGAFMLEIGSTF